MKLTKLGLLILSSFFLSLLQQSCTINANAETEVTKSATTTTLDWNKVETLEAIIAKDPKPVIVDIYTDWCKWCKVMDKQTFKDPRMTKYLKDKYHMVKFNAEQKSQIEFKNKVYDFVHNGMRGYNNLAFELTKGKLSYPSLVVLDQNLNPIKVINGFQSTEKLMSKLEAI